MFIVHIIFYILSNFQYSILNIQCLRGYFVQEGVRGAKPYPSFNPLNILCTYVDHIIATIYYISCHTYQYSVFTSALWDSLPIILWGFISASYNTTRVALASLILLLDS